MDVQCVQEFLRNRANQWPRIRRNILMVILRPALAREHVINLLHDALRPLDRSGDPSIRPVTPKPKKATRILSLS